MWTLIVLKIQHSEDGFGSHMKRIRISVLESSRKTTRASRFESPMDRIQISILECLRKFTQTNGSKSPLRKDLILDSKRCVRSHRFKSLRLWIQISKWRCEEVWDKGQGIWIPLKKRFYSKNKKLKKKKGRRIWILSMKIQIPHLGMWRTNYGQHSRFKSPTYGFKSTKPITH